MPTTGVAQHAPRTERDGTSRPAQNTTRRDSHPAGPRIKIIVESGTDTTVVKIIGELDIGSCELVTQRCTEGRAKHTIVDLADLTFLDCGGYRGFVAARNELGQTHRILTLTGAVGEPRLLLDLIRRLESPGPLV